MKKPPVLNERQFEDWCKAHEKQIWDRFEAQRDADWEHEQQTVREIFEETERLWGISLTRSECDKLTRPHAECRWCTWQSFKSEYTRGKK